MACDPTVGGYACWDHSNPDWTIVDDHYISAPTALRLWYDGAKTTYLMCKYDPANHMIDGRASFWMRRNMQWARPFFYFRNTRAPGTVNINDGYDIEYIPGAAAADWLLRERSGGAVIRSWTEATPLLPLDQWVNLRWTWWETGMHMEVQGDTWNGAAWVPNHNPFQVAASLHAAADYQRVGFALRVTSTLHYLWIDDFIISSID